MRSIISALALLALLVAQAKGAVLAGVEGAVTVTRDGAVINAMEGAGLAPGDAVHAGDGSARIVYENGCAVNVGPRQDVLVAYAPPCQAPFRPPFFDHISFEDLAVVAGAIIIILVVALSPQKTRE